MKFAALVLGLLFFASPILSSPVGQINIAGTYNFYLYFGDSSPFLDELTLELDENQNLRGRMHVPNDFDAELEGIVIEDAVGVKKLSFFIALPEKYHEAFGRRLFYELHFLSPSPLTIDYEEQFVGFVTHHKTEYRPTYVGSVAGFRKKK